MGKIFIVSVRGNKESIIFSLYDFIHMLAEFQKKIIKINYKQKKIYKIIYNIFKCMKVKQG